MARLAQSISLAVLLSVLSGAAAQPRLQDAHVLEEAMAEAIRRTEPAMVCLLVSRSEGYRHFGALPTPEFPGKLGSFDGQLYLRGTSPFDHVRRDLIKRLDLSDSNHVPESYGSGVVIDATGLVLTNYHVVREATKVFVRLPGRLGSYADIHAADPRSDLAVLKLLTPPRDLIPLRLGRGEEVRKGQIVLALANPYAAGFRDGSPSASWGIISNLRRRAPDAPQREEERTRTLHHYGTLIQTDVRLNLGCSGGALVNLKGEFIALTSALAALTGTDAPGGFAIPLNAGMRRIVEKLKEGKEVEYGFLGISFASEPSGDEGVRITDVAAHSPAADAGLKPFCRLLTIDGTPIHDTDELFLAIGTSLAGSRVRLEVATSRQGQVKEHVAVLAKFHVPGKCIASDRPPALGGLRVDYTSTLIRGSSDPRSIPRGVVIREILPASPAEEAHLRVDQVITRVNGRPVATPAEYYRAARQATGPVELTLSNDEKVKILLR
jgi:S1-C subfamily serine protease